MFTVNDEDVVEPQASVKLTVTVALPAVLVDVKLMVRVDPVPDIDTVKTLVFDDDTVTVNGDTPPLMVRPTSV